MKPVRLVRTARVASGAVVALLVCWAPASQATVYTASATDPEGDLSAIGDVLPDPAVDFRSVSVQYDDATGRVDVSFTFGPSPADTSELHAGVGLGSVGTDGSCSAPSFTSLLWHMDATSSPRGEAAVEGHSTAFTGNVTGKVWSDSPDEPETWTGTSWFEWAGSPKRTFNFATTRSSLVGRHYTCAFAGMWVTDDTGAGEEALDGVLELRPLAPGSAPPGGEGTPPPLTPPPTASGSKPSQILTGRRARRAVKSALARRYGRAFRRRQGYTASCAKVSDTRWGCAVRWRYKQAVYKGKVTLRLRPDGRVATRIVLRKIPR